MYIAKDLISWKSYCTVVSVFQISKGRVSTWKCGSDKDNDLPGLQIDMIIERADRMIHLCEMKFSQKAFNISGDYEKKLRDRMWLFDTKTKNKKNACVYIYHNIRSWRRQMPQYRPQRSDDGRPF